MEPTSAKKIISLQLDNANYSKQVGVLRDSLVLLEVENKNLKLEVAKLKEQLASISKQEDPVLPVESTEPEQELSKKDALDLLSKVKKGNMNGLQL